jgi:hypothetical protein
MAEQRVCVMTTTFAGRADSQSLGKLNRLLDEGWRITEICPELQRLPGVGNFKAFVIELVKPETQARKAKRCSTPPARRKPRLRRP